MSCHDGHEAEEGAPSGDEAVIARYARRKDYHDVLRPRLARLGRYLAERRPGSRWRTAVDSAPVLERELAQRAGLGWIGKNTCLINRRLGSDLLLGELFTTVELESGVPDRDHCGTCTACLSSCPTGAFAAPGVLDSRRCISYLTIEHRGDVPAELRRTIGRHLFGCDVCQAICPWNRRAEVRCDPVLRSRSHLERPSLGAVASLDDRGFRLFAAGTPLRRLDGQRFLRNVRTVAANLSGP
jgi:epoxyqueuosine reductase